jgi:hypothetical protein
MKRVRVPAPLRLPVLLLALAIPAAAQEIAFDASAFEKKPYELGGYLELKQEAFDLHRDGAFYRLTTLGLPQRESLDRTTATLQLVGKLRYGIGTFDFRTSSSLQRDESAHSHDNSIYEAAYSIRPDPGFTLEAGKRALKWGKGYAWNPMGFVERPKDPNDPQLAREGFVMADADWIASPGGALQTIAFTPVLLPVESNINGDFGSRDHLNPAAKLYLLYKDTDLDFAWQGKGSRPARFGFDFSRNVTTNFEIHGEWARILQFAKPITNNAGHVTTETGDATSFLLGLRYLSASDTTYIAEYYRNGTGYSDDEAGQFYRFVDTAFTQLQQTGSDALVQRALSLSQGSYGRPNPGTDYVYFRAQQKDALGIVYFTPAITAMANLRDHSFQVTPELQYTGFNNLELRLRLFLLHGGSGTDFGEKLVSRKLELLARYYF